MDPEGARLLTYSTTGLRYSPPVHIHHYIPPRNVLQQAAALQLHV